MDTNRKLRFTGIAGALVLAASLFTTPAAIAGERSGTWLRDGGDRVERHYDRDRRVRRHRRTERRAHRRTERRSHRRTHRERRYADNYRYHDHRRHGRWHTHRHGRRHWHGRSYSRSYGHGHNLGPVAAGIGLGILTYAIIDAHRN
jgi:hypothetical protein